MEVLDEVNTEPWGTLVVPGITHEEAGEATSTSYFIKSHFSSTSYSFLVTDLTSVWVQSCDRAEIKRLKQEFNPLVDTPVARILLLVKQSLVDVAVGRREHSSQVKHQVEHQAGGRLSLQFSTKIDFYCFKWTFDCAPLSGEEQRIAFLRTSFLQPLLVITSELQQQLRELKSVIALKDAEIAEYKTKGIKLPKVMQTPRFVSDEFEDRRLVSNSFQRTLRQPTFSLDGITGKIYQKLTAHQAGEEEKKEKILSRQASCPSLPLLAASSTSTQSASFDTSSSALSPGESKRKRMRTMQPTIESVPSLSLSEASDDLPQSQGSPSGPELGVNPLCYQESPEERSRKVAIRQRLEALAKKKEEKKQVKATKRKFQFI